MRVKSIHSTDVPDGGHRDDDNFNLDLNELVGILSSEGVRQSSSLGLFSLRWRSWY